MGINILHKVASFGEMEIDLTREYSHTTVPKQRHSVSAFSYISTHMSPPAMS